MPNSVLVSVKKYRRIRDACNCIASFIKRWEQDEAFRTHKRRFGRENLPSLSWLPSLLVPTQVRSRKGIERFLDPPLRCRDCNHRFWRVVRSRKQASARASTPSFNPVIAVFGAAMVGFALLMSA